MNPLGVISGEKELKLAINIDLESIIVLCVGILLAVMLGVIVAQLANKFL